MHITNFDLEAKDHQMRMSKILYFVVLLRISFVWKESWPYLETRVWVLLFTFISSKQPHKHPNNQSTKAGPQHPVCTHVWVSLWLTERLILAHPTDHEFLSIRFDVWKRHLKCIEERSFFLDNKRHFPIKSRFLFGSYQFLRAFRRNPVSGCPCLQLLI